MSFNDIWNKKNERAWNELLKKYWSLILIDNIQVEYELNRLSVETIAKMNERQWYRFLYDEYFFWKYTAKNRLATTRAQLKKYKGTETLDELLKIKEKIIELNTEDIKGSLAIACEIKGLGVAGASGLLSLIYPSDFATVDQFVVKALFEVDGQRHLVENMIPENLALNDGVILTKIMRKKAASMNEEFNTKFWTPRTLEMVLWAYRS